MESIGTTAFSLTSGTYAPSEEATDVVLTTGASAYESTATANAGTYSGAIDISGATGSGGFLESNYLVTYLDGDYVINPAPLTITADDLSKVYGDAGDQFVLLLTLVFKTLKTKVLFPAWF